MFNCHFDYDLDVVNTSNWGVASQDSASCRN